MPTQELHHISGKNLQGCHFIHEQGMQVLQCRGLAGKELIELESVTQMWQEEKDAHAAQ